MTEFYRKKKKVCYMCAGKTVDYKDVDVLRKYVNERGKILPRRVTGTCAKHQRIVAEQIKRASKTIGFKQNDTISKLKYNQWLALFDVYLNHVPQNKKFLVNNAYKKLLNQQSTLNKVHRNRNYIDIIRLK